MKKKSFDKISEVPCMCSIFLEGKEVMFLIFKLQTLYSMQGILKNGYGNIQTESNFLQCLN